MTQKISISAFLLAAALQLPAQDYSCDRERYVLPVFEQVEVTYDVVYGHNTTLRDVEQELLMDIYQPVGDTVQQRPLIIMAHGGAFIIGNRSQTALFCEEFASRGYVVANMAYRLIDKLVTDSVGMFTGALMAIHDMRAAVRFFREDYTLGNTFKVDTSHIFTAGVSAGGIMASQLGFWDQDDEVPAYMSEVMDEYGGFEGNSSDNTQFRSSVHGVLNYSGALFRKDWVDAGDVPVYSAHDELDPIVPCGFGSSRLVPFPVYTYGSCSISAAAGQAGIPNQLYLVPSSSGHVSYKDDPVQSVEVYHESALFLKSILCQTVDIQPYPSLAQVEVYPNPFSHALSIEAMDPITEIRLIDMQGRTMKLIRDFPGGNLNVEDLPTGLYIISIQTLQGRSTQKIMKTESNPYE